MATGSGLLFRAAEIREKGGLHATRPLDPAHASGIVELVFARGLGSLQLEARVSAKLDLECARCGKNFSAEFTETFDEVYEDTVEFIDVRAPALEAIALMAPMKPLCSAGCKGLCPVCGCDRNRKTCLCKKEDDAPQADMRFSVRHR